MKHQRYSQPGRRSLQKQLLAFFCTAVLGLLAIDSCGNPAAGQSGLPQTASNQGTTTPPPDTATVRHSSQASPGRWLQREQGVHTSMVEFWHWPDYEGIEIIRDVSSGGTICAITVQSLQPGNTTPITQRLELTASGIDALQQALRPLLQTQPDPYQQRTTAVLYNLQDATGQPRQLLHRLSKDTPAWAAGIVDQLQVCSRLMAQLPVVLPLAHNFSRQHCYHSARVVRVF